MKDGAAAPGEDMDVRSLEPSGETGSSEGETTWKVDGSSTISLEYCWMNYRTDAMVFKWGSLLSLLYPLTLSRMACGSDEAQHFPDLNCPLSIFRDWEEEAIDGRELKRGEGFQPEKKKKRHVYREFLIHKHNLHTPFPIFSSSGILQKETWQGRIVYNQSQKDILQEWFKQNPYPDKATRKQRAKEIGIPESKIQIWFKNHRAKQRRLEFGCSFGKNKTQGQHQYQPWTQDKKTTEYLPKAARQNWTPITRSQSHTLVQAFERNQFPDITTRKKLAKIMGIQEPRIQTWFQNQRSLYPGQSRSESMNSLADGPNGRPGLTAQQHQINQSTLLGRNYLPMPSTLGGDLSDTQTLFWSPNQEKCQNHKEQSGIGILQLKDYSQPHPEDQKHQLQDLEQVDISYILQRWDNVRQALIAKWDPGEGTH
ncbi:double homeobox protein B [Vulpes lagopus]|uniref:double homeobox protein B n=1 Tax=Vulpes lagopus TaxID=494514 RepID=UPI001BC960FB|nr:double homeobox protein B [Vulpes lagopus]